MNAQAEESVRYVQDARQRAKRDAGLAWVAGALYPAFAVAAVAVPSAMTQGKFLWIVAAPIAALGAALWAYSDGRERGVEASRLSLVIVPFGLLTLAFALGALAWSFRIGILAQYGPPLLMAVGYTTLGLRQRQRPMVFLGIVVLVVTVGLVVFDDRSELPQAVLGLAYVMTLLAIRFGWRLTSARRP